jgi:pimeloyl-ACP methyl ester carboxylesterase
LANHFLEQRNYREVVVALSACEQIPVGKIQQPALWVSG